VKESFVQLRYDEDPTLLIEEIVELANSVARTKLKRRVFQPVNGNGLAMKAAE